MIALALLGATIFTSVLTPYSVFAVTSQNSPSPNDFLTPPNNNTTQSNTQGPSGDLFPVEAGQLTPLPPPESPLAPIEDKQAAESIKSGGANSSSGPKNPNTAQGATTDIVSSTLTCSAGTLLGNLLRSAISSMISALITSIVGEVATDTVLNADKVPTNPGGPLLDNAKLSTSAHTGTAGPFGLYINIGWDAVAWCVINAMIEYIANATIAWANSGFNGNPAFIQNPERFFQDLADYQAGSIIRDIAYGATGVNVCQPFRVTIAVGLAQTYGGSGQNALNAAYGRMSCKLSDITQNNFFQGVNVTTTGGGAGGGAQTGRIGWNDWASVTQVDSNNPHGAYIMANEALYAGVSNKQNELRFEVGLNNGWLNFKKCSDPKDSRTCNTTTPGRLIESSLNQTLGLSKQRLVMANKFDEMVTAIVNNLIKVALNKVLEEVNN